MRGARAAVVAVLLAATVAACQAVEDAAMLGTKPLRAVASPEPGELIGCMEALLTGTVAGDPSDPHGAWLVSGGERVELGWPYGFGVRFEPQAVVVAPGGEAILRAGDEVSFGGGHVDGVFWICTIEGRSWPPYDG